VVDREGETGRAVVRVSPAQRSVYNLRVTLLEAHPQIDVAQCDQHFMGRL